MNNMIPNWIMKNKFKIKDSISKFKKSKILVIGDLMLDQFIWGKVSRISPEAPVPVVWVKRESFMPGGASNVAHNLSSLGAKVLLFGVIGDDWAGTRLLQELKKKNINTEGIIIDSNRRTTHKTRIIAHSQQVVRFDREDIEPVRKNLEKKLLKDLEKKIKEVDGLIIEDYEKGIVTPYLVKKIVELGKKYKKIIVVDPKEKHFSYYKGVTAITPNRDEASKAVGFEIKDEKTLMKAGNRLLKKLDCKAILLTLGEDGICLFYKNKFYHIPTMAREVYDVSGAGDTVVAVFTLAYSSGLSLEESAYLANQSAGIVVAKVGIAVISDKELWEAVKKWKQ
jgi:D-beta-D-heptose 7-phosphate kinase/D-beta-D-heptose 1-phosphate adenosyltransferase